jgi:hypothetical protein
VKPALAIDLAVKALLVPAHGGVRAVARAAPGRPAERSILAALLTVRIMPRVARDEG